MENISTAFRKAESDVMRKSLEEDMIQLQKQIELAESENQNIDLKESQIYEFFLFVKKIVEHPVHSGKILVNTRDIEKQQAYFKLGFKEFPTYAENASGTPKLSEIYKLRKAFYESPYYDSLWAGLKVLRWNTLVGEITDWLALIDKHSF